LGWDCLDNGHKRVPAPPAKITGIIGERVCMISPYFILFGVSWHDSV
jgi:hypothetical protein